MTCWEFSDCGTAVLYPSPLLLLVKKLSTASDLTTSPESGFARGWSLIRFPALLSTFLVRPTQVLFRASIVCLPSPHCSVFSTSSGMKDLELRHLWMRHPKFAMKPPASDGFGCCFQAPLMYS